MPVEAIGFFLSEVSKQKKISKAKTKRKKKSLLSFQSQFSNFAGFSAFSAALWLNFCRFLAFSAALWLNFCRFLAFSAALWLVNPQASWGTVFGSKIRRFLGENRAFLLGGNLYFRRTFTCSKAAPSYIWVFGSILRRFWQVFKSLIAVNNFK
jgi:hypothetical protein